MARGRTRDKQTIAHRRERVSKWYLQGYSQHNIVAKLKEEGINIDRSLVSLDLKALREEWKASAIMAIDERIAQELAKIDRLENEAWDAWERSKEPIEIETREQTKEDTGGGRSKAGIRKQGRDGNDAFFKTVQWCISKRCELIGINAPVKVAPTTPDGKSPYQGDASEEQQISKLAFLIEKAKQRAAEKTATPAATAEEITPTGTELDADEGDTE